MEGGQNSVTGPATTALELAMAAGASAARVALSRTREIETKGRDGKVETMKESASRALSIELFVAGRYSSHRTTSLAPDRLRAFIDEAVAQTRALAPDPDRALTDVALRAPSGAPELSLFDPAVQALEPAERTRVVEELDGVLRAQGDVISASTYVSTTLSETALLSTDGLDVTERGTQLWVGAEATLRDGPDKRPEGSWYVGVRHRADLPALPGIGELALREARRRLGSIKGPSGKTTLVLDPRTASRLVQRLLGPMNAQAVYQGRSAFAGKVGQALFAKTLTITDEPWRPRGLGSRHFDDEGITANPRRIVHEGRLEQLFVDTYYGKKTGLTVTGAGQSNLAVASGEELDLMGLVGRVQAGIYVSDWLGGNADGTTGDFSYGLRGHLIAGGQLGAAVGEMNVTGNFTTLFERLAAVGNDPWPYRAALVPSMVFEGVDVSGA